MATLHLHVLESTAALGSDLLTTGLQARESSVGLSLEGTPDEVLSEFLKYFGALRGEKRQIELLVDRRCTERHERRDAELLLPLKDAFAHPSLQSLPMRLVTR